MPFTDRPLDDVRVGEMEEQRDDVSESFVKRGHIDVGGIQKGRTQSVEKRMARFMCDHVVTQRCANNSVAKSETGAFVASGEVAKGDITSFTAVTSICRAHAKRPEHQTKRFVLRGRFYGPCNVVPEGMPESSVGEAANCVHHLRMELSIGRRRNQATRE